jgi:Putative peptidoglycan binding domain
MSGREPPRVPNPDDWFVDSDGDASAGRARTTAVEAPNLPHEEPGTADDWLGGQPATTRVASREDRTVKLGTLLVAAAVVLVLILVVGLAIGGVFSGGATKGATTTTTAPTTTQTTPTSTTPTRPALVVAAPATTLKPGDTGVQVKRLQRALKRLGYATGVVDGDYGTSTKAALTRFQKASALTADGVLGPATLKALKQALRKHG